MSESVTIPLNGWWASLTRLWSLQPCNPNQLMRPSDRLESAVRAFATVAMLVAVPIAGAFATEAYVDTSAEIRSEKATKTLIHPVVIDEPAKVAAHRYQARVRWDEDGRIGDAIVPVRERARTGDRVELWLDADGAPTARPRHPGTAVVAGIGVGVFVLVGVWLCGWCLVHAATLLLERRRSALWDRQWQQMCHATGEDKR
ncbi:hypothetical protein LTT66_32130 [Nocardia gipuzkoensis]|uniref:Rv1733c family protein n=1 Tax=Nocardia gipuzkoensis TaxID=2749991 RepID=UPI001E4AB4B8|nr:hypothetical protein [Nocardia gipuzkoensis]UGT67789.1 hypothetical protein LTT66_32130 [Nocardia gipuzkoensis]